MIEMQPVSDRISISAPFKARIKADSMTPASRIDPVASLTYVTRRPKLAAAYNMVLPVTAKLCPPERRQAAPTKPAKLFVARLARAPTVSVLEKETAAADKSRRYG
jgi:hypothetical protein